MLEKLLQSCCDFTFFTRPHLEKSPKNNAMQRLLQGKCWLFSPGLAIAEESKIPLQIRILRYPALYNTMFNGVISSVEHGVVQSKLLSASAIEYSDFFKL